MTRLSIQIPSGFPRFSRGPALIVVSGKQDAVLYEAKDGRLSRLDAFKVPRLRYQDREGGTRGKKSNARSGAVREVGDESVIKSFIRELGKRIRSSLSRGFDAIYLFAPNRTKNKISSAVPEREQKKVAGVFEGNFYYRHPLGLLEKIRSSQPRPFVPETDEEGKILRIPRQR